MPTTPNEDSQVENDHNVYVLGAGYSADAGLPVMANFLQQMKATLPKLDKLNHSREIDSIKKVVDYHASAQSASHHTDLDLDNIEVLFSLVSMQQGKPAEDHMRLAMAATLDFCDNSANTKRTVAVRKNAFADATPPLGWVKQARIFNDVCDGWDVPEYHARAGLMCGALCQPNPGRKNSFITFNYDSLVEEALRSMGVPYNVFGKGLIANPVHSGALARNAGQVDIYKMHGSVTWAVPAPVDEPLIQREFLNYKALNEARLPPIIQPPTWRKDFGDLFTSIWESAKRALKTATRLIVVGFSMPETDLYARYLIAAGLAGNSSLNEIVFVTRKTDFKEFEERVFKCFRRQLQQRGKLKFFTDGAENFFSEVGYGRRGLRQEVDIGRDLNGSPFAWPS